MLKNENGREKDIQCEEESKGQLRGRIFGDLYLGKYILHLRSRILGDNYLGKYTTAPGPYFW